MEINIRRAESADAPWLPAIENSAGQAFRQIPYLAGFADSENLSEEWHRRIITLGTSWVAVDGQNRLIGFLSGEIFFGELHIWEVSVRLDRQREGIGRKLIQQAIDEAKSRGLRGVTLTTFREVAWNEKFYARLGFVTLKQEEAGQHLDQVLQTEKERGWSMERRCAMRLALGGQEVSSRIEARHDLLPNEIDEMEDRIYDHNSRVTGCHDGHGLGFVIHDERGQVIGMTAGYTWAGSSEIKQMWVDEVYRGRGYARALLNNFVMEAERRGVCRIWVASYDFQAPGMYEKAGFKRMAELEGWPEGHTNVILCKVLG